MFLIYPNSTTFAKTGRINIPYHLTRLFEVADYLEKRNVFVKVFDMELNLVQLCDILENVIKTNEKVVIFYSTTENLPNVIKYSNLINTINPGILQIVYGEVASICPDYFINSNFYGVITGETDVELTLFDLDKFSKNEIKEEEIRGLLKNNRTKLIALKKGEYLDSMEWGVPNDKYFNFSDLQRIGRDDQITLTITKGCGFGCNYCLTKNIEGNLYRKRPISEIIKYINSVKYTKFKFFSALFTFDTNYVKELCRAIINNKKKIMWSCCTRADLLQDEEMISLMAQAGCYKVSVGVESLSDVELCEINKNTNYEKIINSIKLVQKYGMLYKALIMIGIPNQSRKDLYITIDTLIKHNTLVRPTAYTPLFNINKQMSPNEIATYDKCTFYDNNSDITFKELLILVNDINQYKILLEEL